MDSAKTATCKQMVEMAAEKLRAADSLIKAGCFNRDFIATGLLPKELSKALGSLFDNRQAVDYDVFQHAIEDEARLGLLDAWSIHRSLLAFAASHFGFTG